MLFLIEQSERETLGCRLVPEFSALMISFIVRSFSYPSLNSCSIDGVVVVAAREMFSGLIMTCCWIFNRSSPLLGRVLGQGDTQR